MRKPGSALRVPGKAVCPPEGPEEGQGPSAPLGQKDNRSQNAAWNGEGSIPVPLAPPDRPSPAFSGRNCLANKPNNRSEISFELWIPDREGRLNILRRARSSPKLWTSPIQYGPPNSNVLS
jgi:hypothetical protein